MEPWCFPGRLITGPGHQEPIVKWCFVTRTVPFHSKVSVKRKLAVGLMFLMPPALHSLHVCSSHCDWYHFNREAFCFVLLSQVDAGWLNLLLRCLVLLIEPKVLPALQPPEQGTAAWAHRPRRIKRHTAGSAQVGGTTVWERHLWEAASPCCCLPSSTKFGRIWEPLPHTEAQYTDDKMVSGILPLWETDSFCSP